MSAVRPISAEDEHGLTAQAEDQLLLSAALELGERLLECGGEVSRVEDTIQRVCASYGALRTDVFAITSSIVVTMEREGRIVTQTRRITHTTTDLKLLERLNALSRSICAERPPVEGLRERVRSCVTGESRDSLFPLVGYILAASAFAVFFGGGWQDAVCAAVCAVLVFLLDRFARPLLRNGLLYTLFCSVCAGAMAMLCRQLGLCLQTDKVMIGTIMLLVPGIALTNALRDLFMGDTISGILRLLEAVLQAGAIACGFALAIWMGGLL